MIKCRNLVVLVVGMMIVGGSFALAQMEQKMGEPGKVIVSIYRVAPGKHLAFLEWMAAREAVDKEAGVTPTQWYVHTDGDSWDFLAISPDRTDAEGKKLEELAKKKGLKTGFAEALEFREFISSHTDTFARGPQSVADLVKAARGN